MRSYLVLRHQSISHGGPALYVRHPSLHSCGVTLGTKIVPCYSRAITVLSFGTETGPVVLILPPNGMIYLAEEVDTNEKDPHASSVLSVTELVYKLVLVQYTPRGRQNTPFAQAQKPVTCVTPG